MKTKRALITGASGFIGAHLLKYLHARGYQSESFAEDLFDDRSIVASLERGPVGAIIHLAGLSHVPTCEANPNAAHQVNVEGTQNLLCHLAEKNLTPLFLFFSTAQIYAAPDAVETKSGVVFDESRKISPQNQYARTKFKAEQEIETWVKENPARRAVILRLFNHTHKTQSGAFFLPHLYETFSKADPGAGMIEVPVGSIDLERDMGSIQDLLEGVSRLLELKASPFEVLNFCSGRAKNLRNLGMRLAEKMGVKVKFVLDPARVRPGEPIRIEGNNRKLSQLTGWTPSCVTEEDLVNQFLADVRY